VEDLKHKAILIAKTKEVVGALNIKPNESPMHKVEAFLRLLLNLNAIENFVNICETNVNRSDFSYFTGYQKFLSLKKEYETKVVSKILESKMSVFEKKAIALADKVRAVSPTYLESEYKRLAGLTNYKQLTFESFGDYFTNEEIEALKKIGSIGECIQIQESISGQDALSDKIFKIISKKEIIEAKKIFKIESQNYKQISSNRVTALIGKIGKGV
jgi:hypothetical protein